MTAERVERPHAGWWIVIGGGLGLTYLFAFSPGAYAWWLAHVTPLPPLAMVRRIGIGAALIHVGEALYARRLALRLGLEQTATGWFVQTLALGFPSLRLLRQRARKGEARS
jgi:Domain of unknown function (DUF4499)